MRSIGPQITRAISVWGLLVLLVLLIIVFSILKPDTFLTYFNIRSILNNKSVQALVALSVFIPMVSNQFDLSAGFNVGISQVLAIGLQGQGVPWWAAIAAVVLMGASGRAGQRHVGDAGEDRLVHRDARHRHGALRSQRLVHRRPAGSREPAARVPGDLGQHLDRRQRRPFTRWSSACVLWLVFEFLPLGRYLYVLGASPRAAEFNGISAKRYITLGFVAAGTLAAFAGVVLQSQLQVGQSSVGQEYLLPAFTAALLGATSVRPGRVNVWGTVSPLPCSRSRSPGSTSSARRSSSSRCSMAPC